MYTRRNAVPHRTFATFVSKNIIEESIKSKQKMQRLISETFPPMSEGDILRKFPLLFRPYVKWKMNEIRPIVDYYYGVRAENTTENETSDTLDKIQRGKRSSSFFNLLTSNHRKKLLSDSVKMIWNTFEQHIDNHFTEQMYESMGLAPPHISWMYSEFFVYSLHMWGLYSRLQFEGEEGIALISALHEKFIEFCERRLESAGIGGGEMHLEVRALQLMLTNICSALDEGLRNPENADTIWAEFIYYHLRLSSRTRRLNLEENVSQLKKKTGAPEEIIPVEPETTEYSDHADARILFQWVKYIRYLTSWLDHTDSAMLKKGLFELHPPKTILFTV